MKILKQSASLFIVLALLLCGIIMTACGKDNNTTNTPTTSQDPVPTTPPQEEVTTPEPDDGKVVYTITVVDNNGTPIEGAKVQLCFGGLCTPLRGATDENGVITSARMEPKDYEVSVTKATGHITVETDEDGNPLTDENGAPKYIKFHFAENSTMLEIVLVAEEGSYANPRFISENTGSVEVTGDSIYYIAFRNGAGKKFYVKDANAILHFNGETYEADENGEIRFEITATSNDTKIPTVIGFSAKNEEDSTFTYAIESDPGSADNPYEITALSSINVSASSEQVVHYKWTATENGVLSLACENDQAMLTLGVNGEMAEHGNNAQIALLKGESVIIAVSAASQTPVDLMITAAFAVADPNAEFLYSVVVMSNLEGVANVTVTIINKTDSSTVATLTTDEGGKATYTGVWNADYKALITLPDGYVANEDKTEASFALNNRGAGFASAMAFFSITNG